jgi:VCBS repeat-containing protein
MQGVITGAGPMVIDQNATLEFNNSALVGTGEIMFEGGQPGPAILQIDNDLVLPDPLVSGLPIVNGNDVITGFIPGDIIDLRFLHDGTATLLTGPHQNVVEVDGSNGTSFLQFDLFANFSGLVFSTQDDGSGGTDLFLKSAPPPPPPPVTEPDVTIVDNEKKSTVTKDASHGVLANDSNAVNVTSIAFDNTTDVISSGGHASITGKYGILTLNSDGSYSYTVTANGRVPHHGVAEDSFTYTVSNGHGSTAQSSLTVALVEDDHPKNDLIGMPGQTLTGGNGPQILDASLGNQTVNAGNGSDVLIGGSHDVLNGGNGPDILIAAANDILNGGRGPDTFVFAPNFGQNTIECFNPKQDYIEFDHSVFANVSTILAHVTNDISGNAVITDPHNSANTVTLDHVAATNIDPHHFIVV